MCGGARVPHTYMKCVWGEGSGVPTECALCSAYLSCALAGGQETRAPPPGVHQSWAGGSHKIFTRMWPLLKHPPWPLSRRPCSEPHLHGFEHLAVWADSVRCRGNLQTLLKEGQDFLR